MIIINRERWRVRLVSPSNPFLIAHNGWLALGACDDITKTIYINNTLSRSKLKKVLCHEIVHAVMFSYNVDLSDQEEEMVADLIATYGEKIINLTNASYIQTK